MNPAPLSEAERPLQSLLESKAQRLFTPLEKFIRQQAVAGVLLLFAILLATFLANVAWGEAFDAIIRTRIGLFLGRSTFGLSIAQWVSDGLLALFFFLVGLEIKREILIGQLQHPKRAYLVIAAALGGMIFPALIYSIFNYGTPAQHGWAIPMTTDTAFAVGVLALMARRISISASIFLAAIAIIDDIVTIGIIAFFYTDTLDIHALYFSLIPLLLLFICNLVGIRKGWIYGICGLMLWWYIHQSGVHATLAGLLMALAIPARSRISQQGFIERIKRQLIDFEKGKSVGTILTSQRQHQLAADMEATVHAASTPLQRWHSLLEGPIAIIVLPLFALFNAGIAFSQQSFLHSLGSPVALGIVMGLVIGKPLGITLFGMMSLRAGLGQMPPDMRISELVGIGFLSGIGFTMSLFIALLGFEHDSAMIISAKIGILISSLGAALLGGMWLMLFPKPESLLIEREVTRIDSRLVGDENK